MSSSIHASTANHDPPEDFDFLALIGRDDYSKTMLAATKGSSSKELYAVKVMRKELLIQLGEVREAIVEKTIHSKISRMKYPFIAQLYGAMQTDTRLYLLMEYLSGGDLMYHCQRGSLKSDEGSVR